MERRLFLIYDKEKIHASCGLRTTPRFNAFEAGIQGLPFAWHLPGLCYVWTKATEVEQGIIGGRASCLRAACGPPDL